MGKRGRPFKMMQCFKCPKDILWKRKELRRKKKMDLCPEHYEDVAVAGKTTEWPSCPNCGLEYEDFVFDRNAKDYTKSKIRCLACGSVNPVKELFTASQMAIYVKPVQRRESTGIVETSEPVKV